MHNMTQSMARIPFGSFRDRMRILVHIRVGHSVRSASQWLHHPSIKPLLSVRSNVPKLVHSIHTSHRCDSPKVIITISALCLGRWAYWYFKPSILTLMKKYRYILLGGLVTYYAMVIGWWFHEQAVVPITGRSRFISTSKPLSVINEAVSNFILTKTKRCLLPLNDPRVDRVDRVLSRIIAANQNLNSGTKIKLFVANDQDNFALVSIC